jgi:hypothetical protein
VRRTTGRKPPETLPPRSDEPDEPRPYHWGEERPSEGKAATGRGQAPETGTGRVERWQRLVESRDEATAAAEMTKDARRRASAIVKEAEEKAAEIIAAAEDEAARITQAAAHERTMANDKRAELSTLLLNLLREVQRTS